MLFLAFIYRFEELWTKGWGGAICLCEMIGGSRRETLFVSSSLPENSVGFCFLLISYNVSV